LGAAIRVAGIGHEPTAGEKANGKREFRNRLGPDAAGRRGRRIVSGGGERGVSCREVSGAGEMGRKTRFRKAT